ncbi:hypothetical protein AV947_gp22 [Podophage Lau218]|uniref:Putative phage protein n=2 Tax=Lauvirus lau218 TaxID=1465639 RepID=A0A060BQY3_9CAUD|nr:hypothetical protein AV947_gp22 [Podophage Lau218]AIA83137.1 putative phage protein [Podophage Lau218]AIA83185.1 putative phage protein [Lauvirus lau218]AIA83235.1 putative phage protein [Lauvirus lau218]
MTKTILKSNVVSFLENQKNNFTLNFFKKNGERRSIFANFNTPYLSIGSLANPHIIVNSIIDDGIRSVNVNTIDTFSIGNTAYRVI